MKRTVIAVTLSTSGQVPAIRRDLLGRIYCTCSGKAKTATCDHVATYIAGLQRRVNRLVAA